MRATIYIGPMIPSVGLQRGALFKDGKLHAAHKALMEQCPALRALFIPITEYPAARKDLKFDLGRNMRGSGNRLVTLYREVEQWLANKKAATPTQPSTGVQLKNHA